MSVGKSIFYFCLLFLVSMVAGMSQGMLEDAEQEYYRGDNYYVIEDSGPLIITLNPSIAMRKKVNKLESKPDRVECRNASGRVNSLRAEG